jgi:hypothetical protein
VYYYNVWNGQSFPFLSQQLFYENGERFNQTLILDENFRLDPAKLAEQGLPWFASSQVIAKIGHSLAIGATITHVFIWYGKDIIDVIRKYRVSDCLSYFCLALFTNWRPLQRGETYDPHLAKMKVYPEVPVWWYLAMFAACFAMAMSTIYAAKSGLPW